MPLLGQLIAIILFSLLSLLTLGYTFYHAVNSDRYLHELEMFGYIFTGILIIIVMLLTFSTIIHYLTA